MAPGGIVAVVAIAWMIGIVAMVSARNKRRTRRRGGVWQAGNAYYWNTDPSGSNPGSHGGHHHGGSSGSCGGGSTGSCSGGSSGSCGGGSTGCGGGSSCGGGGGCGGGGSS